MTAREINRAVWVCTDCYFAHHYGAREHDGRWYAGEFDEPCEAGEPLRNLVSEELSDWTDSETGDGIDEFSSRWCDGCDSHYAGARYRLAVWS